ncbi:MAG TPA: flavodoxin family protein [Armatimonadota bacterium]|jgi:multimeric flavodoxin WrbA
MKALCIIGSPRDQGSTAQVVDRIIAGMTAAGVSVSRHLLDALRIGFCQGCKACVATALCVQQDDMDLLISELLVADIVLLASPSYWGDVTAQMKTFIDRCTPLTDARPGGTIVPKGKRGIAVAIRAGESQGENEHLIATIHHFFGHLGITPAEDVTLEGIRTSKDLAVRRIQLEQAYEMGYRVGGADA